jgi:hypothetical protein
MTEPKTCDACDEEVACLKMHITDLEGVVIESLELCAPCANDALIAIGCDLRNLGLDLIRHCKT